MNPGFRRRDTASSGYVLVGAMVLMALMAIGMTVIAQQWSFVHRRSMEKELQFQGDRIMRGLLEYKQMQGAGLKPAGALITNYESMVKALTEQPNPILTELPPDPMTARYNDQGELEEDTGVWGLVIQTAGTTNRTQGQATTQTQGGIQISGCPPLRQREGEGMGFGNRNDPLNQGNGLSGTNLPSVFEEPNPTLPPSSSGRSSRLPPMGAGGNISGNVIGVVTCYDEPDQPPIRLSPAGEEASTYRDWLFVPKDLASNTGNTNQPAAAGSWESNWPESMPAPATAPGTGGTPRVRPPGAGLPNTNRPRGTTNPRGGSGTLAPRGGSQGSTFPRGGG